MDRTLAYYATVLHRDFSAYAARELQRLDLSFGVLFFVIYVGKHPGCTPAELTSALHADWGHSQRCVSKLVEGGFMTKERAQGSGRSYRLDLTERGREAFDLAHEVFYAWDAERLGSLDTEERAQLLGLLAKLVRTTKEDHPCTQR